MSAVTSDDLDLISAASALLLRSYDERDHRVAAAVRGASGSTYLGLHLGSDRVNVCAEPSAIANARIGGEDAVHTIVAVGMDATGVPRVVNPCGVCRELVRRYGDDIRVIVDHSGELDVVQPADLLPIPWVRAQTYDS
ncbi:hypothetical protein [Microbacterium murale]|uniref:Cytidine deaminase n=1 Tax=Microbacterium murale TaxID=1081040 RepID=A0ABU0P6X5_9MICO|nr:hypothetical protein [Microbacterium murale]MDQ0643088.1 cytidine deaminase [Microbacterium murale]